MTDLLSITVTVELWKLFLPVIVIIGLCIREILKE